MNRHEIETLLLKERDGALTPEQSAILKAGLVAYPHLHAMRSGLETAFSMLQRETASVTVPEVEGEWRTLRARLREESQLASSQASWPRLLWLGSSVAAAAAVVLVFFNDPPIAPTPTAVSTSSVATISPAETARADYVEAGDADASTLVYVDKDSGWLVVWTSNPDSPVSG